MHVFGRFEGNSMELFLAFEELKKDRKSGKKIYVIKNIAVLKHTKQDSTLIY